MSNVAELAAAQMAFTVAQTLTQHFKPWQAAFRPPKAKRAKRTSEADAVLLGLNHFTSSKQQRSSTEAADASLAASSNLGSEASVAYVAEVQQARQNSLTQAASVHQLVAHAAQCNDKTESRVLQINGFMNYLVFTMKDAGQQAQAGWLPEANKKKLMQLSLLVRVIGAAVRYAGAGLSVLAVNIHLLHGHAMCHAICYAEEANRLHVCRGISSAEGVST